MKCRRWWSAIIFITGGVRSGKSAFAERIATQFGKDKRFFYIATGVPFDEEMKARIKRHQLDRAQEASSWNTVEMQVEVPHSMTLLGHQDVVLFECLTTWLSNVLYVSEGKNQRSEFIHNSIEALQNQFINWREQGAKIVIVSNEVLDEPTSIYEEVNRYRKFLGQLHQSLVKHCDEAYEVQFQLVQRWK